MPRVSIIIVNWNGRRFLKECLDTVFAQTFKDFEVILVDNGSSDGSAEFVRREYPLARVMENRENLGFVEGNNAGIRRAKGELLFLLNNDTKSGPEMLGELVTAMASDGKIGVAGPLIYFHSRPNVIWAAGGEMRPYGTQMRGFNEADRGQYGKQEDVDFVTGCALMARRGVVEKIGLLDRAFWATCEDVDWCLSAREAGYRVVFVPAAKAWHKTGGGLGPSMSRTPRETMRRVERNMLYLARKHGLLTPTFMVLDAIHLGKLSLKLAATGNIQALLGAWEGKIEFYSGKWPDRETGAPRLSGTGGCE